MTNQLDKQVLVKSILPSGQGRVLAEGRQWKRNPLWVGWTGWSNKFPMARNNSPWRLKRARQIKVLPRGKKVKVENNGILNPHFPPSCADVSCQLLIFSVYGSDFLFLQFFIYSVSEDGGRWISWNREYRTFKNMNIPMTRSWTRHRQSTIEKWPKQIVTFSKSWNWHS